MSRTFRIVTGSLLLAVSLTATACASTPRAHLNRSEASTPSVRATEVPASSAATRSIDQAVHADAEQMMSDIASAPIGTQASSNPFSYVGVSPAFERLVARGTPAVEAIAREIERSPHNGLREYLLAIAASRILEEPESEMRWSTAKGWVSQYRSEH